MKVVLFCGGFGTRLREFSHTIPAMADWLARFYLGTADSPDSSEENRQRLRRHGHPRYRFQSYGHYTHPGRCL